MILLHDNFNITSLKLVHKLKYALTLTLINPKNSLRKTNGKCQKGRYDKRLLNFQHSNQPAVKMLKAIK